MRVGAEPDLPAKDGTWLVAVCGFLAVAAFLLWTEHRAHLLGIFPYLVFLLCPLFHLLMHRGRHGHGHDQRHGDRPAGGQR